MIDQPAWFACTGHQHWPQSPAVMPQPGQQGHYQPQQRHPGVLPQQLRQRRRQHPVLQPDSAARMLLQQRPQPIGVIVIHQPVIAKQVKVSQQRHPAPAPAQRQPRRIVEAQIRLKAELKRRSNIGISRALQRDRHRVVSRCFNSMTADMQRIEQMIQTPVWLLFLLHRDQQMPALLHPVQQALTGGGVQGVSRNRHQHGISRIERIGQFIQPTHAVNRPAQPGQQPLRRIKWVALDRFAITGVHLFAALDQLLTQPPRQAAGQQQRQQRQRQ